MKKTIAMILLATALLLDGPLPIEPTEPAPLAPAYICVTVPVPCGSDVCWMTYCFIP